MSSKPTIAAFIAVRDSLTRVTVRKITSAKGG